MYALFDIDVGTSFTGLDKMKNGKYEERPLKLKKVLHLSLSIIPWILSSMYHNFVTKLNDNEYTRAEIFGHDT